MMKSKTIKQLIRINAKPNVVYEAMINPKKHSKFTGSTAIDTDKIGKFSIQDGYIFGENINLIKDKMIVQKWRCKDFPEKHYSEVIFEFKEDNKGTKLIFTQKNVPLANFESILKGWEVYYWKPLKKMLEK